jgi:hypothetical protein
VFVNHSEEVEFEGWSHASSAARKLISLTVGREKSSKVGISVRGEKLEFFIIGGGSMKAVCVTSGTWFTRLTVFRL